ncbi:MAG: AAA family ATPase [Myxococcota bacterium]|nr:AAA family ATPase [Myxococcota bacterium]
MRSLPDDSSVFRFDQHAFVARDCELRRDGEPVPLARKPAQLLLLLLRNRGRVVSREEILATLWPDTRVSEAALYSVVRDLRRALTDEGREPRLVATARGHGLRFVGSVQVGATDLDLDAAPRDAYIGREPVLAMLRSAFDSAREGAGRLVVLSGEAGVGKTRTAREFAEQAREAGASVHYGRCWRPGFAPPYRPWVELFESMRRRLRSVERDGVLEPPGERLAFLLPSLGVAPDGENVSQHARFDAFESAVTWLQGFSRLAPVVLVIDDLEDADHATLELFEFVASLLHDTHVLLIGNLRTPGVEAGHPLGAMLARLARLPHFERIALTGLDADETRRFVTTSTSRAPSDAEIDSLHARTDGNPFLLGLFARSLPDATLAAGDPVENVPTMAREWIRGTLLSLAPDCVECLQAAAVIGRIFEASTVAMMVERALPEVEEALLVARRAGLLGEPGPPYFRFAHGLLQEAIYDDLPPGLRSELHRRAGEAMEAMHPDELLASVARHLTLAADLVGERAVETAERAAAQAERRLAFEDAVRLRDLALGALRAVEGPTTAWRCELTIGRARALLAARRVPEAWAAAREAAALARELASGEQLARAALLLSDHVLADSSESVALLNEAYEMLSREGEPSELRAQVACALSQMLWYHGQSERRMALAAEARSAARSGGDARLEIAALLATRHALHSPEHLDARIAAMTEALALTERSGYEAHRCLVLSWRAVDLLERGDGIGAQLDVETVERVVVADRAPRFRAFPARWRALRATLAGRFDEARARIQEAHELMLRTGDPNGDAYAGIQTAVVWLEQGRGAELAQLVTSATWIFPFRERIPCVAAALAGFELEAGSAGPARRLLEDLRADDWRRLREDPELLGSATWLAEICARLEDADFAAALHDRLASYWDRIGGFYAVACRGSFARYLGLLARTAGRLAEAERSFAIAIEANRAIDAAIYVAWSQWELAETLALGGAVEDRERARRLAAEARQTAEALGVGRLREAMRRSPAAASLE